MIAYYVFDVELILLRGGYMISIKCFALGEKYNNPVRGMPHPLYLYKCKENFT